MLGERAGFDETDMPSLRCERSAVFAAENVKEDSNAQFI